VYCTCTAAREENIDNVRWFAENFPFAAAPLGLDLPASATGTVEDGCLQLLPGPRNDGFFIAKFIKSHA
jgi:16S rRNA C967 or C1407 C5-methylase (RsmB/RsmF family)